MRDKSLNVLAVFRLVKSDLSQNFAQICRDVIVDRQLSRVDDTHIHAVVDGVVQEHTMESLSQLIEAPKGKTQVREATAHLGMGTLLTDDLSSLDKIDRVVVMFDHSCGDRQDIQVKNDVLRWEANLDQELVGSAADLDLFLSTCSLTRLIKCHHDDSSAVFENEPCLVKEVLLSLLERDGVDDTLALAVL